LTNNLWEINTTNKNWCGTHDCACTCNLSWVSDRSSNPLFKVFCKEKEHFSFKSSIYESEELFLIAQVEKFANKPWRRKELKLYKDRLLVMKL
jgi:hypothetical protein